MESGHAEVEASQVIQLVLQFLHNSGLEQSAAQLTQEAGVALNAVLDPAQVRRSVECGKWEDVLPLSSKLALPTSLLHSLHEHILIELAEIGEIQPALSLLSSSEALQSLRSNQPERFSRLRRLLDGCSPDGADVEFPGGLSRDQRRTELAEALEHELTSAPPNRLLELLGHSLRWQRHTGQISANQAVDLLRGPSATSVTEESERIPERAVRTLRFDRPSRPECAIYSPDGSSLALGTCDGFVEIYGAASARLRDDLQYQANGEFLAHDEGVMALAFSNDSELLLTGTSAGRLKAFRVRNGKCVRRLERAHRDAITSVSFSPDAAHVLSASLDGTARVHGLRSGTVLRELREHGTAVHGACYTGAASRIVTTCFDGSVHSWDAKTGERLYSIDSLPHHWRAAAPPAVSLQAFPKAPERALVCSRAAVCHLVQVPGLGVTASYHASTQQAELIDAISSPKGSFVYCLSSNGMLYCFNASTNELEHRFSAHSSETLGLCHHPQANLVTTFATDGEMKMFTPS